MTPEDQIAPKPLTLDQLAHAMKSQLLGQMIEAHPVTKHGVGQLLQLWGAEFTVGLDQTGRPELKTYAGPPASEVVKSRLASPEFAHYLARPAGQGGAPEKTEDQKQAELVERARRAAGLPSRAGIDYVPLGF